ncbi:RNase P protein subunit [Tieghemostelium lacteum]|uniref:Ribonuclease P protein subunit p20 n=1 Tax=Tieghemostelium lacteum TaxID=361077 RepID=A0A151Z799_TIELA|nr:RNase P protein subunit [Tieghemostelium lacteum]|eukprot:KYQ89840.1 RNase P protein subunit [Tieghemostelium lacteum]
MNENVSNQQDDFMFDDNDDLKVSEEDLNNPYLYCYKRRTAQRAKANANDVYIANNGQFILYVKRCKKLLLQQENCKEVVIHGLGAAIIPAIKLSLYLQKKIPNLVVSPNTGTEEIIDQYDPLRDDLEPVLRIRRCSSIHIRLTLNQ